MKCRKAIYRDHTQAVRAVHMISSKGTKKQTTPVRTYRCEECGYWHITHRTIEEYLNYYGESVQLIHTEKWKILQ